MNLFQRFAQWLIQRASARAPDFIIGERAEPYIRRWWVIPRNPFFNIYLHEILRGDPDRALHCHPWANVSILLQGGYIERLPLRQAQQPSWDYVPGYTYDVVRKAGQAWGRLGHFRHRLFVPEGGHCWSLFLTGPVYRRWGFHCKADWVYWRDYVSDKDKGLVGRGCGEHA